MLRILFLLFACAAALSSHHNDSYYYDCILDKEYDFNNADECTPLLERFGNSSTYIDRFIEIAKGLDDKEEEKQYRLVKHIRKGNIEKVKKILSEGADPNTGKYGIDCPFYIAIKKGNTAIVAALIDAGADVNLLLRIEFSDLGDCYKTSPLATAALKLDKPTFELLCEHGAKIHEDDDNPGKILECINSLYNPMNRK